MAKLKIDGKEYDSEDLSSVAKSQLQLLQFCDNEISELNLRATVFHVARSAYAEALKLELEKAPNNSVAIFSENVSSSSAEEQLPSVKKKKRNMGLFSKKKLH